MTDAARRLLGMLAVLPDGIAHADLDALLPDHGEAAAATLRTAGLAFDDLNRLRSVQPIRDHADATQQATAEDLKRLVRHWCDLTILLGGRIKRAGGAEAVARLTAELGNIHAMLEHGLAGADPTRALDAAIALAQHRLFTGLGSEGILRRAVDVARDRADLGREAELLLAIGDISYTRMADAEVVIDFYRRAEELYQRLGDLKGQGDCLHRLGDAVLVHDDYATAATHFSRAQALYEQAGDPRGQADCFKSLGDLALARDEYDAATAHYEQARSMYQKVGELLGQANCTRRLGNIARKRGDFAEAERCFTDALGLFEQVGDIRGQANCTKGLGDVALAAGDNATATASYRHANSLFEQTGDVLGQAICVKFLGDAALARNDRVSAVDFYLKALPLYEQIPQPYSTGTTYRRLARLSVGAERERYIQAAREVWTGIGRHDMTRQLDDEFGQPAVSS